MFVGVVVVAIVGNGAEHSTAVLVVMKNRMDLSIQIAIGSALQIALFVAPVRVFARYLPIFPERLNLMLTMLEVVAVGASVMIVGLVAYDGQSNWLEGLLLLAVYVMLAIAIYLNHTARSRPRGIPCRRHTPRLSARDSADEGSIPDYSSGNRVKTRSYLCVTVWRPGLPGVPKIDCVDNARRV